MRPTGQVLATCSADTYVKIYKETDGKEDGADGSRAKFVRVHDLPDSRVPSKNCPLHLPVLLSLLSHPPKHARGLIPEGLSRLACVSISVAPSI